MTNIREGKLEFDLSSPHFITIDGKKLAIGEFRCGLWVFPPLRGYV